jgi:methyltransferase (TIGR00027 family)
MTEGAGWGVSSGVGFTALAAAGCRAIETLRDPALIQDPYAAAFVRAASVPVPVPATPQAADADATFPWSLTGTYVAVRTRYFDDYMASAIADGIEQIVIMAAGLDTRAFRLDWPSGTTLFELDVPLVLGFKDRVLGEVGATARCTRRAVATDLREDWPAALGGAGFDPSRPAAWLAEGLLLYLPDSAKAVLLGRVDEESASGSLLAVEQVVIEASRAGNAAYTQAARRTTSDIEIDMDALWAEDHGYDPVSWLRASGWQADVTSLVSAARSYGRPLPPGAPEGMLGSLLIAARKH